MHPETPAEGISLEELFAGRSQGDRAARQEHMRGLMAQEGLPYGTRTHTYNSRLAQELGAWAATQPDSEGLHTGLFQAYFVDGKNIGDIDTLVSIASAAGLSGATAREALSTRRFHDVVEADWQRSRAYGITGVPTFVAAGRGVVGAQPYEALERLLQTAGATRRET